MVFSCILLTSYSSVNAYFCVFPVMSHALLAIIAPPLVLAYTGHLTACICGRMCTILFQNTIGVYGDIFFQQRLKNAFLKTTHVHVDKA